jgi:hypothetical protein
MEPDFAGYSFARVTQRLADHLHGNSHGEEERSFRVAEFVNGPGSQPGFGRDLCKVMAEVAR